jgi:hypothetical protein
MFFTTDIIGCYLIDFCLSDPIDRLKNIKKTVKLIDINRILSGDGYGLTSASNDLWILILNI